MVMMIFRVSAPSSFCSSLLNWDFDFWRGRFTSGNAQDHKNDWMEILQKNEEFYNKLKECLIDKLTIKFKFDDYKMETEDIDFTADNDDDYAIAKTKNVEEEELVDSED